MEIHEITCSADADTFIAEYIRNTHLDTNIIDKFEEEIEEWAEEFDTLEREVKFRGDEEMNHYKLNKVIGLYFLIPTALFYIGKWKEESVEAKYTRVLNLEDDYPEDAQRLWDENSLFDSEPE